PESSHGLAARATGNAGMTTLERGTRRALSRQAGGDVAPWKRHKQSTNRRRPDLAQQVRKLAPWFHNLHLPDGTQTCPDHWLGDFPSFKWEQLAPHVPKDLRGWSCLDIGCNAGFYTFELAKRGGRVLSVDVDDRYLRQARWAAKQFGLERRVRFQRM